MKKESKDKMKVISKFIYIIAKINCIFISIAGVFIILGMLISPFIISNLDANDHNVTIFGHTYDYEITESKITVDGNLIDYDHFDNFHAIINAFENYSDFTLISITEFMLIVILAVLAFIYMALRHVYDLFKNIHDGYTPFTEKNISHIKKIAKYMIIAAAVPVLSGGALETITNHSFGSDINLIEILAILILFAFAYVFEYGYKLQQEIDTTL